MWGQGPGWVLCYELAVSCRGGGLMSPSLFCLLQGSPGEGGALRCPNVLPSAWCRRAGRDVMLLLAQSHSRCAVLCRAGRGSWAGGTLPPSPQPLGRAPTPSRKCCPGCPERGGSGGVAEPVVQRCPAHGSSRRAESRRPRLAERGVDPKPPSPWVLSTPGRTGDPAPRGALPEPCSPQPLCASQLGGLDPHAAS